MSPARRPALAAAMAYWRFGLNVIPVDASKRPLVRWKELQSRRVTAKEMREWWGAQYPTAGVAMICGAISGRVVVDLDPRNADAAWLELDHVLTRLQKVRPCRGAAWTACCPAHDDKEPSLSVRSINGRVLLHCFAGCRFDAIVRSLGLAGAATR